MARVNVNILAISELKWTGMGEFNLDDHYIYYCGQESLRRNVVAIMVNKRVKMQYLDAISKMNTKAKLTAEKCDEIEGFRADKAKIGPQAGSLA